MTKIFTIMIILFTLVAPMQAQCKELESNNTNVIEEQNKGTNWLIFRENDKYGYMDKNGNIKIDAQFVYANDFIDGRALVGNPIKNKYRLRGDVMDNIYWGYIDTDGVQTIPLQFDYAQDFENGFAYVRKDNVGYYIDKYGNKSKSVISKTNENELMPKLLRGGSNFPSPFAAAEVWSYIDSTGKLATNKEFEKAEKFQDNMAIVKSNGKYGIIDSNFNAVINCKYDDLLKVDVDLFAAKIGDKWGLIDKTDKKITDFEYFWITPFNDGLGTVCKKLQEGKFIGAYINKYGELLLNSKFSMVNNFVNGYACVTDKISGKDGVINFNGEYVIPPQFYSLSQAKCGLFKAKDKAEVDYYYINLKGEKIIPKK